MPKRIESNNPPSKTRLVRIFDKASDALDKLLKDEMEKEKNKPNVLPQEVDEFDNQSIDTDTKNQ